MTTGNGKGREMSSMRDAGKPFVSKPQGGSHWWVEWHQNDYVARSVYRTYEEAQARANYVGAEFLRRQEAEK